MQPLIPARPETTDYPSMAHLDGFWDPQNWADDKWAQYKKKKRGSFGKRFADLIDQILHQWMGKVMSREDWEERERKQWPSSTGSYDPCNDHYNFLLGAGEREEAEALKREAQSWRPEFLA